MEVADIPGNVDRRTLEDAMTLPTIEEARSWRGLMLVATGNEPVGRIDAVYVDRTTRQPGWALVHTGRFGSWRTCVPLMDAAKLGDTVRVPHDPGVVREAPRLEPDADLSESDEACLYAHYRIDYTTAVSPSGLPATDTGTAGADATAGPRLEADAVARPEHRAGGRRPLLAGLGALALAAIGSGLALLRARRRRPPSFGDRLAKAGRDAADTLTSTAGAIVREAAAAGAKATVAKRTRRGRARARKRAEAAAGGAARSLAGFPTAAGRRMQRLGLDRRGRMAREQARKAVPRRRRRSNMKVIGKLGMMVGAAVGYVLGAKAGRERYEQIAASARQLMEKPQVKRVMESAPGNLGARVEQVANKAADAVHQASDRVAPSDAAATGATTDGPGGTTNAGKRSAAGSGSRERSKNE